jgi:hypothetical protein
MNGKRLIVGLMLFPVFGALIFLAGDVTGGLVNQTDAAIGRSPMSQQDPEPTLEPEPTDTPAPTMSPLEPEPTDPPAPTPLRGHSYPITVRNVTQIAKEFEGPPGQDQGRAVGLCGADLGSVFSWLGRTYIAFGDIFGCPLTPDEQPNWRAHALAFTTDTNLSNGITFNGWITNSAGNPRLLFRPDPGGFAARPTHGVSVGNTGYLFYSNVTEQFTGGRWNCNSSSAAKSTNRGRTWQKLPQLKRGSGNFNQVFLYKTRDFVYFFSIPCGRLGGVKLMRVRQAQIENRGAYEYLMDADNDNSWERDAAARAAIIVPAPVGELSVIRNNFTGGYIMSYLTGVPGGTAIVMRIAPNIWGPWGSRIFVVGSNRFPCLYAPFTQDSYVREDGRIVYFRMSRFCPGFNPYSSYWMRMELARS